MICSLLAGCMKNAEAVNFAGDIDLGEDGVITKDVFSQLRDSGEIASICGKSGEISYKWTVPGTEVTNPQDLCMAVAITEKTDGSVEITLKSDKASAFCRRFRSHSMISGMLFPRAFMMQTAKSCALRPLPAAIKPR